MDKSVIDYIMQRLWLCHCTNHSSNSHTKEHWVGQLFVQYPTSNVTAKFGVFISNARLRVPPISPWHHIEGNQHEHISIIIQHIYCMLTLNTFYQVILAIKIFSPFDPIISLICMMWAPKTIQHPFSMWQTQVPRLTSIRFFPIELRAYTPASVTGTHIYTNTYMPTDCRDSFPDAGNQKWLMFWYTVKQT